MKVLHILNEILPSGAEVMLKLAHPHWKKQGIEITLLATGKELGRYASTFEELGCPIIHLPAERMQVVKKWKAFKHLFAPYDAIHIHTQGKSHLFAIIARMAGKKALTKTVHNNFKFTLHTRIRTIFERSIERILGVVQVAISDSVLQNEKTQFFNQCQLVRNWIDTEHFKAADEAERNAARRALGVSDEQIVLVSVGNGSDTKNYQAIIKALHLIKDPRLHYFQVGMEHSGGTDRHLVDTLALSEQVTFVGPVSNPRAYLWAADIYLMPSKFEGFGLSAAEALACGLPCVFASCPGLTDWKFLGEQIRWSEIDASSVASATQTWITQFEDNRRSSFINEVSKIYSAERGAKEYAMLYNS